MTTKLAVQVHGGLEGRQTIDDDKYPDDKDSDNGDPDNQDLDNKNPNEENPDDDQSWSLK